MKNGALTRKNPIFIARNGAKEAEFCHFSAITYNLLQKGRNPEKVDVAVAVGMLNGHVGRIASTETCEGDNSCYGT